ncbi:voltage-dependent anion channel [Emericellopsis atlantica]|uniref:Voltage-dependent anion channel n=1 Tax=Emericellopsis atlantica TaxID=2614577 RepID=A0A9P8CQX4_9HYPO|nr:voltage-dependent anion channel [Emericellopsis atlantica]KAG9255600.1 voltage-dependent anion channel [Emericellopsis atlantica]
MGAQPQATQTTPARTALQHFSTPFFLIPQGTGIIAVILHSTEYQFTGLQTIAVIFWMINLVTLLLFSLILFLRIVLEPKAFFRGVGTDPSQASCLASISVSFSVSVMMVSLVVVPSWGGRSWANAVYALWWVAAGLAIACCVGVPLLFLKAIRAQGGFVESMTPTTQLPMIAALTAAAAAGTIASSADLERGQLVPMLIVGFLLVGLALPLAVMLDVLFLIRMLQPHEGSTGGPLPAPLIYTDMVLCGPWGQASYALQSIGQAMTKLKPVSGPYPSPESAVFVSQQAVAPIGYASMLGGIVAWGQATFWWTFAVFCIVRVMLKVIRKREPFPFAIPSWSIVFPWGVYTNATVQLGKLLDSPVCRVWSTILVIVLVILWLTCSALTLRGVFRGTLLGLRKGWKVPPAQNGAA